MPPSPGSERGRLTRADLPAELTADTLRHVGLRTLHELARSGNGVLDAEEQRQFNAALAELRREAASRAETSLDRSRRAAPANLDPSLRRSYLRTQRRLAEQAERVKQQLPEATGEASEAPLPAPDSGTPPAGDPNPSDEDVSSDALEQEVDQTTETLDILERIASLQQQQLEHQHRQLLSETRGLFFGFLVSVAVIVAGVAPLVEATAHDRFEIVLWTLACVLVAALAYAVVRSVQSREDAADATSSQDSHR